MRTIKGIKFARRCEPKTIPAPSSAVAKAGIAYEKKVFKALQCIGFEIEHNPWFLFKDSKGFGYCVPDILMRCPKDCTRQIIIECKLKYKDSAIIKLERLYRPVVSIATNTWNVPLVIVKYLSETAPTPALSLLGAINSYDATGEIPVLHWMGKGVIM